MFNNEEDQYSDNEDELNVKEDDNTTLTYLVTDIKIKLKDYVKWDALPLLEFFNEDQWIDTILYQSKTLSNVSLNRR